jgi:hypothetical protein
MATAAASLAVVMPVPVFATHSLPGVPTYWDTDNDGGPNPNITYHPANSGSLIPWNSTKTARLGEAMGAWNNGTQYNPILNTVPMGAGCSADTSCHGVYLDTGPCGGTAGDWSPGTLAVTCRKFTSKKDPLDNTTYYDIYDMDIYLWMTGTGQGGSQPVTWSFAATAPIPMTNGVFDARGIFTHETGHTIRLIDLYSASCNHGTSVYTMCGEVSEDESVYQRSLQTDDINAANAVY